MAEFRNRVARWLNELTKSQAVDQNRYLMRSRAHHAEAAGCDGSHGGLGDSLDEAPPRGGREVGLDRHPRQRHAVAPSASGDEHLSHSSFAASVYGEYGYLHSDPVPLRTQLSDARSWSTSVTAAAVNATFDITIAYAGDPLYRSYFDQAAQIWSSVITADLPDVTLGGVFIDDLLIDASAVPIDGQFGILGQAGFTDLRLGTTPTGFVGGLPSKGLMQFDSADLGFMVQQGILLDVILHEMGHVLGIGTLWDSPYTTYFPGPWDRYTGNPANQLHDGLFNYTGPAAIAQFQSYGGNAGVVPIANGEFGEGLGSIGSHWRESTFVSELMTYRAESVPPMPLSRISIGTLADMGYSVNYAAAAAYQLPGLTDTAPPLVSSISVNGSILNIVLDETLSTVVPAVGRFSVLVNGVARAVSTAAVNASTRTVALTLAAPVTAGQAVTIAYTDATAANDAAGVIQDVAGNDLASFAARAVTNNTPVTDVTPPLVSSVSVNGSILNIVLNETLSTVVPAVGRFSVLVNGVARAVSTAAVNASTRTVALTLAAPVTAGQAVTIAYTDATAANDAAGVIQDVAGNDLASFAATAVANTTPAALDDYPATTGTTGLVPIGSTVTGNLEQIGDHDWFRVNLVAGATYEFTNVGSPLSDPTLGLRDSAGLLLAFNDDSVLGRNSLINYTAPASGVYYLDAGAFNDALTGGYVVGARPGEIGNTPTTAASISVGSSVQSQIDFAGDADWFAINLIAGATYTFTSTGGTLVDPFLALLNSSGIALAANDDGPGLGLNSRITFTATYTGVHYLEASAFNTGVGSYVLAAV